MLSNHALAVPLQVEDFDVLIVLKSIDFM
jgi:hypothetical protein